MKGRSSGGDGVGLRAATFDFDLLGLELVEEEEEESLDEEDGMGTAFLLLVAGAGLASVTTLVADVVLVRGGGVTPPDGPGWDDLGLGPGLGLGFTPGLDLGFCLLGFGLRFLGPFGGLLLMDRILIQAVAAT